jgi:hypothetical protein
VQKQAHPAAPKNTRARRRAPARRAPARHHHPADEKPVEVAKAEPKKEEAQAAAARDGHGGLHRQAPPAAARPIRAADRGKRSRARHPQCAGQHRRHQQPRRDDANESGGVFSISNKTFHSMDLKFRGWNPNFKRRWLTSVTVEQGSEPDVETAVVKKMIELIRKEKTGDFEWDSHRLTNKVVTDVEMRGRRIRRN